MKKRWSDIKETAHHVLLSTGLVIWSKITGLTIWSEKGASRVKSIGLIVWLKLTTKLTAWRGKLTNKIKGARLNKRHVIETGILLILFAGLTIWLNNVLGWLTEVVFSLKVQWQAVGILGLTALPVIFYLLYSWRKSPWWRSTTLSPETLSTSSTANKIKKGVKCGWVIALVVLVGLGVLVYYKYDWDTLNELSAAEVRGVLQLVQQNTCATPEPAGDIFKIVITQTCPAVVKMNPNQMMVWWGDKSKFRTGWYFERREVPVGKITHNKFRVFKTRDGVDRVIIKIHGYYDPDPLWYTRQ